MEQKSNTVVKIVAILGIISAIFALIIAFLPLRMFAFIPGIGGLLLGLIAYFLDKKAQTKKKLIYAVLGISLLAIVIAGGSEILFKNEVEKDTEFEQKIEKTNESVKNDLNDALKDLEKDTTKN